MNRNTVHRSGPPPLGLDDRSEGGIGHGQRSRSVSADYTTPLRAPFGSNNLRNKQPDDINAHAIEMSRHEVELLETRKQQYRHHQQQQHSGGGWNNYERNREPREEQREDSGGMWQRAKGPSASPIVEPKAPGTFEKSPPIITRYISCMLSLSGVTSL
jgi:hypothetical protein